MADTGGHRLVVVVTFVAVLCLVPAAHGSPPDPTWIAGLYDNADFDDVVFLITSALGVAERTVGCSLRPQRLVTSIPFATDSNTQPLSFRSSALGRAPPVAEMIVVVNTNAGILASYPLSLTRLPRIDNQEAITPDGRTFRGKRLQRSTQDRLPPSDPIVPGRYAQRSLEG
jgi:hypothetical protein